MATYFISDLHLNPAAPHIAAGFKAFVEQKATDAHTLYILGDFFDAWIGDDEDANFYQDILKSLKKYTDGGLSIKFMHGNRDFLVGEDFASSTGVEIIEEPTAIDIAGKRVLLLHGDSLCTTDTEYMAFRAQVRNPAWQAQVLSLPLDQRRAMAAQLRAQSKSMNSNKAEDIMDVNPIDVDALFTENPIDVLIHGHTHRPNRHALASGERIVLGDWGDTGWYIRADDNCIELIEFTL